MMPMPAALDDKFKTELCVKYLDMGVCPYGMRCRFAHGEEELREKPKPRAFRTKACHNFSRTGHCAYGERCNFLHLGSDGKPIVNYTPAIADSAVAAANGLSVAGMGSDIDMAMAMPMGTRHSGGRGPMHRGGMDHGFYAQRPPGPLDSDTRRALQMKATMQWESMMPSAMRHESGLYSAAAIEQFTEERPSVSERFQAWKEMRAEGPLPDHCLILKDNAVWRAKMREAEFESKRLEQKRAAEMTAAMLATHYKAAMQQSAAGGVRRGTVPRSSSYRDAGYHHRGHGGRDAEGGHSRERGRDRDGRAERGEGRRHRQRESDSGRERVEDGRYYESSKRREDDSKEKERENGRDKDKRREPRERDTDARESSCRESEQRRKELRRKDESIKSEEDRGQQSSATSSRRKEAVLLKGRSSEREFSSAQNAVDGSSRIQVTVRMDDELLTDDRDDAHYGGGSHART